MNYWISDFYSKFSPSCYYSLRTVLCCVIAIMIFISLNAQNCHSSIRPSGRTRQYLTPWVSILFQRCSGVIIILMKAVLTLSFTFIDLELSFKKNDPGRHLSNAVCELLNLLHQSYIVTGGSVRLFNTTDGSSGLNWFGRVLSDLRRWVNTCGGMHCIGVTMWDWIR